MKYLFELEQLNPTSLEKAVGLKRGDILSMTTYPGDAVEIETKIALSTSVEDKIKAELNKCGYPKGKKSISDELMQEQI